MPLTRTHGDADLYFARVRRAAAEAVNAIVDDSRDDARVTHAWDDDPRERTLKDGRHVDTHLERQIVSEHANPGDHNPTGSFGYRERRGFYGLFHDEGTVHEYARPTLRPAADRNFPRLSDEIRERLQ